MCTRIWERNCIRKSCLFCHYKQSYKQCRVFLKYMSISQCPKTSRNFLPAPCFSSLRHSTSTLSLIWDHYKFNSSLLFHPAKNSKYPLASCSFSIIIMPQNQNSSIIFPTGISAQSEGLKFNHQKNFPLSNVLVSSLNPDNSGRTRVKQNRYSKSA